MGRACFELVDALGKVEVSFALVRFELSSIDLILAAKSRSREGRSGIAGIGGTGRGAGAAGVGTRGGGWAGWACWAWRDRWVPGVGVLLFEDDSCGIEEVLGVGL